jgi:hypothetical protein
VIVWPVPPRCWSSWLASSPFSPRVSSLFIWIKNLFNSHFYNYWITFTTCLNIKALFIWCRRSFVPWIQCFISSYRILFLPIRCSCLFSWEYFAH